MQSDNIPIDRIGIQGHYSIFYPTIDEIKVEKYASLGLKIQITELDISLYQYDDRRKDSIEFAYERMKR